MEANRDSHGTKAGYWVGNSWGAWLDILDTARATSRAPGPGLLQVRNRELVKTEFKKRIVLCLVLHLL